MRLRTGVGTKSGLEDYLLGWFSQAKSNVHKELQSSNQNGLKFKPAETSNCFKLWTGRDHMGGVSIPVA